MTGKEFEQIIRISFERKKFTNLIIDKKLFRNSAHVYCKSAVHPGKFHYNLKKKTEVVKPFYGFYFGLSFLEDVQQPIFCIYFADAQDFRTSIRRSTLSSIAFIRVASMNSDARLSEKAASMISLTPLSLSKSIHPKSVTSPSCSI